MNHNVNWNLGDYDVGSPIITNIPLHSGEDGLMAEAMYELRQKACGTYLNLPLNFAVNLKLSKKNELLKTKRHHLL